MISIITYFDNQCYLKKKKKLCLIKLKHINKYLEIGEVYSFIITSVLSKNFISIKHGHINQIHRSKEETLGEQKKRDKKYQVKKQQKKGKNEIRWILNIE